MAYSKFNKHKGGEYWNRYVKTLPGFYKMVQVHLKESLSGRKTIGIDIGAGPGVIAILEDKAGLKSNLTGYEPSKTYKDGEKVSNELKQKGSSVKYKTIHAGITAIKDLKKESLDYITIIRASHEIAE